MFESAVEWSVNQINENFQLSAELDKYTFDLGGEVHRARAHPLRRDTNPGYPVA